MTGHRDAGPWAAQGGERALVHREGLFGAYDRDLGGRVMRGERLVERAGLAYEHDGHTEFAHGANGAGHGLFRGVVPAHRVQGYRRGGRQSVTSLPMARSFRGKARSLA
jgi:hypothetical protein